MDSLMSGGSLKGQSLASFNPFVDEIGLLRVGGRLEDSSLDYNIKHPLLLSPHHPLTEVIVRHFHEKTKHQGRHLTLGTIRSNGYFVEKGSKMIKRVISNCVPCKRLRALPEEQMMAPLPKSRMEMIAPFHNTGIDVFGPYTASDSKSIRQNRATRKIWGLILTCLASRAIHVETLIGLDTSSLKNALRRFIAVRGTVFNIYSDCGTNFIGVSNQETANLSLDAVKSDLETIDCTWHFNPPHASHFGGAWERKIGALKRILEGSMNLLKERTLSRDEFSTLLMESMAIVNNTPMWEITADPKDPIPISPSMLLTLKDSSNAQSVETPSAQDLSAYGTNRWRRVQFLADCFWKKWRLHYLGNLQQRSKWLYAGRNVKIVDVILLRNKTEKRNMWPMAIIKEVKFSSDDLVRSVTEETVNQGSRKTYQRPISEIVLLIANN